MTKKKLLITTDSFLPRWDGIARVLSEVIPRLTEHFSITVVAPAYKGRTPAFPGVKIVRVPLSSVGVSDIQFAKFSYRKIKKLVKSSDVVFNHTIGPVGMCAIKAASSLGKKIFSYIHSIEWELTSKSVHRGKDLVCSLTKKLVRYLYNKCDVLLVPSPIVATELTKIGIRTEKNVVMLGTDIGFFVPAKNKSSAKRKIGVSSKQIVLGFCGRIGREKDILTLYRAFNALREEFPELILVVVGGGLRLGDLEIPTHDDRLLEFGSQDNVLPYYQAFDLYVLPSLTETTSLTTLEAMACGLPVITTRVGAIEKYITDGKNGLHFKKQDITDLAEKIRYVLVDERRARRMGNAARKTVVKMFSWDKMVEDLVGVLGK